MSQLTKKAISASFLRLSESIPFEKITVRDIVEDCGINRNTFYYYYSDIYDLAQEVFSTGTGIAVGSAMSFAEALHRFSAYARDHRRAVTGVYRSVDRAAAVHFIEHLIGSCLRTLAEQISPEASPEAREEAVGFALYGLCGLLFDWLETGMKQPPETLSRRCEQLACGCLEGILHKNK